VRIRVSPGVFSGWNCSHGDGQFGTTEVGVVVMAGTAIAVVPGASEVATGAVVVGSDTDVAPPGDALACMPHTTAATAAHMLNAAEQRLAHVT
jgi:hypothetical protein